MIKKVLAFVLVFLLALSAAAQAMTVREFVDAYNERIGKGYPAGLLYHVPAEGETIRFLMGSFAGSFVAVQFDPASAEKSDDCTVQSVFVRHKPRTSMGQFMAAARAAMGAVFPDADGAVISDAVAGALAHSWILFGEEARDPIAWNTDAFGQLVFQETVEYDTFMFSVPGQ